MCCQYTKLRRTTIDQVECVLKRKKLFPAGTQINTEVHAPMHFTKTCSMLGQKMHICIDYSILDPHTYILLFVQNTHANT